MEKWADYLISAVRYEENLNSKVISYFKIHRDNGNSVGEGLTWTMEEVLDAMQRGETFLTISKVNGGKWRKGKSFLITSTNALFLNTDSKKSMYNNLVTIPEF
jgi:hypothetical protein